MLRTRLFFGLLPLLLVLVGTGAYAIRVCHELAGPLQKDLVDTYTLSIGCQNLRSAATLMANALNGSDDPIGARREYEVRRGAFVRELMAQSASSAGKPRQRLVEVLDTAFTDFSARCEAVLSGGASASLEAFRDNEDALNRLLGAIDRLVDNDRSASRETQRRAEQLGNTAVKILSVAIGAAIGLSAILAWSLAASLLRPIKTLTSSAVALGEGKLDTQVPVFSRDELGSLALSFNTMASRLREYREATLARVMRTQRTMEATLTSAPDPLFVISREGAFEVRNPAAEELAMLPEFTGGLPPALAEPLARVFETDEHYLPTDYARVVTYRVGGEDRHYLPRMLAIGDRLTGFNGAAVILQDVTKFRLLDDAKSNLVGTVSHELKTPLTGLRMAVYLLLEKTLGPLSPAQREMLESARDDADRLLRILDSLLDLTRLEAGASALDRQRVPVEDLLRVNADEARFFISAAGQRLVVDLPPGTGEVNVDANRLRHVFINLLSNASKYSPAGGTITLAAVPTEEGFVRFSVLDEGEGIPPEAMPHLFDRFYRVPGQSKQGAGIGLAIAREIVVAHGGSIGCSNRLEGGAEFHFLVPMN
jgi:NtrC-family two-component system sensor histidine kinase KinB